MARFFFVRFYEKKAFATELKLFFLFTDYRVWEVISSVFSEKRPTGWEEKKEECGKDFFRYIIISI